MKVVVVTTTVGGKTDMSTWNMDPIFPKCNFWNESEKSYQSRSRENIRKERIIFSPYLQSLFIDCISRKLSCQGPVQLKQLKRWEDEKNSFILIWCYYRKLLLWDDPMSVFIFQSLFTIKETWLKFLMYLCIPVIFR